MFLPVRIGSAQYNLTGEQHQFICFPIAPSSPRAVPSYAPDRHGETFTVQLPEEDIAGAERAAAFNTGAKTLANFVAEVCAKKASALYRKQAKAFRKRNATEYISFRFKYNGVVCTSWLYSPVQENPYIQSTN